MSEENQSEELTEEQKLAAAELEALQGKANALGVKFHTNAGADTLRQRILEREAEIAAEEAKSQDSAESDPVVELTDAQKAQQVKKKATRLVRCRVTCMDPTKKDWEGEIISAGNSVCKAKRFVPFGVEWHVEEIILNYLRTKKCQTFITVRGGPDGKQKIRRGKQMNAYAIEILNPLTEQELQDLAQRQAMAGGTAAAA